MEIYCKENDVPYPLSKVKKIIRKIESIEGITPEIIQSLVGKRVKILHENYLSYIGIVNSFMYHEEEGWFEFYLQTEDENINFLDDEVQRIEIKEE